MMTACACMGPMFGEPKCPCAMEREGLPLNLEAREASRKHAEEQMKKLFEPGGCFYKEQKS